MKLTPEEKLKRKIERDQRKKAEELELGKQLQKIIARNLELAKKRKEAKIPVDAARRGTLRYDSWQTGIRKDGQVFRGHCGRGG